MINNKANGKTPGLFSVLAVILILPIIVFMALNMVALPFEHIKAFSKVGVSLLVMIAISMMLLYSIIADRKSLKI
jgi:uncharacterized BrkB/YihY/UPF0761 family membrane protein